MLTRSPPAEGDYSPETIISLTLESMAGNRHSGPIGQLPNNHDQLRFPGSCLANPWGDQAHIALRAPGAQGPPAEAAGPRLKIGDGPLGDPISSTRLQRGPFSSGVWASVSQILVTDSLFEPNK